jgi:predicted nucleic acid-binding Zn ribbon protein
MQKISDKPLSRHARCGGKLTKEWSQTSFQLKGSGWYVTDYAGRKSETKETKSDSSDAKTSEAKPADAKAPAKESKPAKPSATKTGD